MRSRPHVVSDLSTEQSVNQRGQRSGVLTMTLRMAACSFGHEQNAAEVGHRYKRQGAGEGHGRTFVSQSRIIGKEIAEGGSERVGKEYRYPIE